MLTSSTFETIISMKIPSHRGLIAAFLALVASLPLAAGEKEAGTYFIDVHELGPGNVTAAGVAEAHVKDLAKQGAHGVRFVEYWVDEKAGRVYCLSQAARASHVTAVHREAHGLLPARILTVAPGEAAAITGKGELFLDVHQLGAGNVSAEAVADAHRKDLAAQAAHGVNFVNYWVDEANGTVLCLSEAPTAEAVTETHRQAHGLVPDSVVLIKAGK